jgi:polar amino acid transport system substrate-binding protein
MGRPEILFSRWRDSRMRITRTVAIVLPALLVAGCGPSGETTSLPSDSALGQILDRGELVIGTEAEFRPFCFVEDGEIVGFDIDLARTMAEELGVELRIENLKWTALPPALETGKIDIILAGMTATLERAKRITFTDSYFQTGLCVLLHAETTEGVESVHDLNDPRFKVVTKTGTTGDHRAPDFVPKAERYNLQKEVDCALEVSQGKADAFLFDKYSVLENHRRYPDTTRVLLEPFTYEPYAGGIRKGDFDWWNWLNQFFHQIRHDGRYDEIVKRWIPDADEGD